MKLYEITEQHKQLEALADENEDMAQAVADTMEGLEGDFEEKALSLISVVNNIGGDIPAIDEAIKRLAARKKTIQNKQDSMKEYLRSNMESSGITKITCPLFTITLAEGRDIVSVDDENAIPAEYMNYKTTASPMKKEILSNLKEGKEIDGVTMIKSKTTIRIK